jgi:hypothetical protein
MVGTHLACEKRNELTSRLAVHFTLRESVQQAGKYIDGLMSDPSFRDYRLTHTIFLTTPQLFRTAMMTRRVTVPRPLVALMLRR